MGARRRQEVEAHAVRHHSPRTDCEAVSVGPVSREYMLRTMSDRVINSCAPCPIGSSMERKLTLDHALTLTLTGQVLRRKTTASGAAGRRQISLMWAVLRENVIISSVFD